MMMIVMMVLIMIMTKISLFQFQLCLLISTGWEDYRLKTGQEINCFKD